jgi:hypothetical protein
MHRSTERRISSLECQDAPGNAYVGKLIHELGERAGAATGMPPRTF